MGCANLTSITLPDTVTSIGNQAFRNSGITSITIPDGVTRIRPGTFRSPNLTSITIPSNISSIENYAFANANSLTTVISLATAAPTLGTLPFYQVPATTITVPKGSTASYVTAGADGKYGGLEIVEAS